MPDETPPPESFWVEETTGRLAQGDYLLDCPVPMLPTDYGETGGEYTVSIRRTALIVVSQSCDLANEKIPLVASCPIMTVDELRTVDEKSGKADRLEEIRKGKYEALHMLSSPVRPGDNWDVRVVDFRVIHSLPINFLNSHALKQGARWRLRPPYLEHFSQAFARFFMRVGLPSSIPRFKK